jgi:hypothetical protein
MSPDKKRSLSDLIGAALLLVAAFIAYLVGGLGIWSGSKSSNQTLGSANAAADIQSATPRPKGVTEAPTVTVSDTQLSFVKVEPVTEHEFPIEKQAVGTISFNEELSVQVFTPYQGELSGSSPKSATM